MDGDGEVQAESMPDGMTGMVDRLRELVVGVPDMVAVLEKVGYWMPGDHPNSAAKIARHCGQIEAALYALGVSFDEVAPGVWMKSLGTLPKEKPERAAAGPGKLCLAMQIGLSLYGTKLEQGQAMWVEHRSSLFQKGLGNDWQAQFDLGANKLIQTTRIGLTQGIELPWRWYLKGCQAVSKFG